MKADGNAPEFEFYKLTTRARRWILFSNRSPFLIIAWSQEEADGHTHSNHSSPMQDLERERWVAVPGTRRSACRDGS